MTKYQKRVQEIYYQLIDSGALDYLSYKEIQYQAEAQAFWEDKD